MPLLYLLATASVKKSNKYNQCDYPSSVEETLKTQWRKVKVGASRVPFSRFYPSTASG